MLHGMAEAVLHVLEEDDAVEADLLDSSVVELVAFVQEKGV